jgi:DNA (cytosine-5)-methyltransferase 1
MAEKLQLISLFSGCGGMDYGFEAAGFHTAVALEMDHACAETLRQNRRWNVIEDDIFNVSTKKILKHGNLKRGEADLLIGGPPCQPFSKSGYWARGDSGRLKDPRADTLSAYMRVVEEAQPRAFVLENVTGLAYAGKDEGLQHLLAEITAINRRARTKYRPYFKVVKAVEHGVPQLRERFFLVAARDGTPFTFPAPMFASAEASRSTGTFLESSTPTYRTAWDAIGDLPPFPAEEELAMRGRWAELLPTIPEGFNYLWHTDRGGGQPLFGWRRRFWNFLLKLAKDRPAWTIQAQPGPSVGPFHWNNRRLSIRELCRLQTFPDDILISGNRGAAQRQIGNAVPSLLAEVIGRAVRTELLGERALRSPLKLLPPNRSPTPGPELIQPVPSKFLDLVGTKTAHPGTGKGYAALARLRATG